MPSLEERLRSRLTTVAAKAVEEMTTNTFSGYLVKKLIVPGSFRNTTDGDGAFNGFQIQVKNKIGVATIVGCTPVKIDGEVFPVEQIRIERKGQVLRAADLSESLPIATGFGDEMMIVIEDDQGLEAGRHTAQLGLKMVGLGIVQVTFDETLSGPGCAKRTRKAAPATDGADDFSDVMRRTVEIAAQHIGSKTLADCAKAVRGIVVDFSDLAEQYSVRVSEDGGAEFVPGAIGGEKILTIKTTRAAFHNMAHNRLNPGIAYARGDIRLEGIPILKLRGMDPVITGIFHGYRAASGGIEFHAAAEAGQGGVIEEIFGFLVSFLDEALKALDKALGVFGVKYFYEKSLNRIEFVWSILDREVRRVVGFGEGGAAGASAPPGAADESGQASAPAEKPAETLRDRLKSRISTAIETAVGDAAKTAVSGYLVKRLVAPGSFRNFSENGQDQGFEVKLKNKLGTATVIGFSDIKVDGEVYALDRITLHKDRKVLPAADISESKPLLVSFGDELLVRVSRPGGMAPGKHRVTMGVRMVGVGDVAVDYEEKLTG